MINFQKLFLLVLIPLLACGLLAAQWEDIAPDAGIPGSDDLDDVDAFGDLLIDIEVTSSTGEEIVLGVEYISPYFYLSGANNFNSPNKVYVVAADGTLVSSFDQPGSDYWGWYDMAFDGTYLYGSIDSNVDYIQLDGTHIGSFPGPLDPNLALAYDSDTGNFWTADNSSDIYEFNDTEVVVNQYPNNYDIRGLAWDNASPDGPWLWVFADSPDYIYQFDPVAGTYTGTSIETSWVEYSSGGLSFTTDWNGTDAYTGILIGVNREYFDADWVFGVEVFACDGCLIEDVCYTDVEIHPENTCLFCDPDQSETEWSNNDVAACDDGEFCNGEDSCLGGICSQHTGDPCDLQCQECNEGTESCDDVVGPCDDGIFCNGDDTCDGGTCSQHTGDPCDQQCQSCSEEISSCDNLPGPCDDGLWCTIEDACSEGVCTGTERSCEDDEFCTGVESCDEDGDECVSSGDPCEPDEICNEEADACDPIADDDADDDVNDDLDDDADDDFDDDVDADDDTADDDTADDDEDLVNDNEDDLEGSLSGGHDTTSSSCGC